ncbi:MAG: hypothetical protein HYU66_22410, partial [Armatimonadetes bacterium]|nr:hypothetical protein [Armatimonadota bacterium]
ENMKRVLFGKPEDANLAWARRALVQKEFDKVHQFARGCEELGVELDEHLTVCIAALQGIAGELGLAQP